ncbi:MAG: SH3 domain-containing protein [Pseudomonadota bacterium]
MLVTFLLLGWAFFELSGGTDFTPPMAEERPLSVLLGDVAEAESAAVARAATSPSTAPLAQAQGAAAGRVPVTRASFGIVTDGAVTVLASPSSGARIPEPDPLPEATVSAVAAAAISADVRAVSATRVNMRGGPGTSFVVLDTLDRGAQAEVIEDPGTGWVRIRVRATGAEGWMAARLLAPVD